MSHKRRALVSVSDKTGLAEFVLGLSRLEYEIVSTGGTRQHLLDAGLFAVEVSEVTGFPEMLGGRVKTLHPKLLAGILARRNMLDMEQLREHDIKPIEIVVCNLYPFSQTIAKPGCTFEEAIEQIDVGGPTMIRAAAKNHTFVYAITSPRQYTSVLRKLIQDNGSIDPAFGEELADNAFALTSKYDTAIKQYFKKRRNN